MPYLGENGWIRSCILMLLSAGLVSVALPLDAAEREVRVGVYENPPKLIMGDDGQPSGILGDLLVEIAEQESWSLTAVSCDWQRCLELLRQGQLDLMPDVAYSQARAEWANFHSRPALRSWSQLYASPSVTIASAMDLDGQRIAVLDGSIQLDYLRRLADGFGWDLRFLRVNSLDAAFDKVASGAADVAVANQLFGDYHAPSYSLHSTPVVFQPVKLFYATPRGEGLELLGAIDQWLARWQVARDSPYYSVLERWSHGDSGWRHSPLVWSILVGTPLLLAVALLFVWVLRRQVRARTRSLKRSEASLSAVLSNVDAYIFIKDAEYRYRYVNAKVTELFGVDADKIIGREDRDFFSPDTAARIRSEDRCIIEEGRRVSLEEVNQLPESAPRYFYSVKQPLRDERGHIDGLIGIATDVTDQRRSEEEIHRLAFYDALTGLPNQSLLDERLEHALATCKRTGLGGAVLFLDLDNFRDLNDSLGHRAGDQLLCQLANVLRARLREGDTLARYSGDAYVAVLEGLKGTHDECLFHAEKVVSDLIGQVNRNFSLDSGSYTPSASIGIALFDEDREDGRELIKRAELAMYQAKGMGRNSFCFYDPVMQAQVKERTELEAGIRRALAAQEFELHYQPQYDDSEQLLGLEALIRWRHPEQGMISPGAFIPVAESSGLIMPLGRWILGEACQQLVRWQKHPRLSSAVVAVNISAQQMHDERFVDEVVDALEQSGADPSRLKLELTESILVRNVEAVIDKMARLRRYGVTFSLDDFGTGFSSLSYLKRLPLDQLKIDQGFVRDLMNDANDAAIVRTVIGLGESLDLNVIAEGVETLEQRDKLREYGCFCYQGYLFCRPLLAQDLEKVLTDS